MNRINYIYELPYEPRKKLCVVLDSDDQWEVLGGVHMKYDYTTLQDIGNGRKAGLSPSDTLLTKWGNKNHTVVELFALLSRMKHFRAMKILQDYVPDEFRDFVDNKQTVNIVSSSYEGGAYGGGSPSYNKLESTISGATKCPTSDNFASRLNNLGDSNNFKKSLNFDKVLNIPSAVSDVSFKNSDEQNQNPQSPEQGKPPSSRETPNADKVMRMEMEALSYLSVNIPYKELLLATDGFANENVIGKGGFGAVYKGMWKNTLVAVKRIFQKTATEVEELSIMNLRENITELKALCQYRHDNILPLYGFSVNGPEPCIVCQYMPSGSLEDRLQCRRNLPPLPWLQRFNIGRGTACGLQYLHTCNVPLVHGDIKSANILLDKNLEPKIADFGLAREGPSSNYTHMKVSKINGTRPYLPSDYLRSKQLSTKVDSYSFGIVQYEVATGIRAYCSARKMFLRDIVMDTLDRGSWSSLKDSNGGSDPYNVFDFLMNIGRLCCAERRKERPDMVGILKEFDLAARSHCDTTTAEVIYQNVRPNVSPIDIQRHYDRVNQVEGFKFDKGQVPAAANNQPEVVENGSGSRNPTSDCQAQPTPEKVNDPIPSPVSQVSTGQSPGIKSPSSDLPMPPTVFPMLLQKMEALTIDGPSRPLIMVNQPAPIPLLSALGVNMESSRCPLDSDTPSEQSDSDDD